MMVTDSRTTSTEAGKKYVSNIPAPKARAIYPANLQTHFICLITKIPSTYLSVIRICRRNLSVTFYPRSGCF